MALLQIKLWLFWHWFWYENFYQFRNRSRNSKLGWPTSWNALQKRWNFQKAHFTKMTIIKKANNFLGNESVFTLIASNGHVAILQVYATEEQWEKSCETIIRRLLNIAHLHRDCKTLVIMSPKAAFTMQENCIFQTFLPQPFTQIDFHRKFGIAKFYFAILTTLENFDLPFKNILS